MEIVIKETKYLCIEGPSRMTDVENEKQNW